MLDYSDPASATIIDSFTLQGVAPANGGAAIDLGTVDRTVVAGAIAAGAAGDNQIPQDSSNVQVDLDAFAKIGKVAYGDIDVDRTDNSLWLVNLNQRALIQVDISGPAGSFASAVNQYSIVGATGVPTCTNGELRPFGLTFHEGRGYLGTVCDASVSQDRNDLAAHVLSFDPVDPSSGYVVEVAIPLTTQIRETSGSEELSPGDQPDREDANWKPWADTWAQTGFDPDQGGRLSYAQPILSDIEFADDGSMIVGFANRFGDQSGSANAIAVSGVQDTLYSINNAGDIIKICRVNDAWVLESLPGCEEFDTGVGPANLDTDGFSGTGEYFWGDGIMPTNPAGTHPEPANGALALLPNSGQVLSTAMDPIDVFAQGAVFFDLADGSRNESWQVDSQDPFSTDRTRFAKGNGVGDIELLVDPAPVEIGNRVWQDDNRDGVQDPGEPTIDGVQVTLTCGADSAAATTANGGQYYFTNADGGNATFLDSGESCTISVPTTVTPGAEPLTLTSQDADPSPNGDLRDSDVSPADGMVTFTLGGPGQNNHTFDIGYTTQPPAPVCDVGNNDLGGTVFRDFDSDGTQAGTEPGFDGGVDGPIVVTAYGNDDTVGVSTTVQPDGTYYFPGIFTGLTGDDAHFRLEFSNLPDGFEPSFHGSTPGSAVMTQRHDAATCEADFAVNDPTEYCENNPLVAASCYVNGDPNSTQPPDDVLVAWPFERDGADVAAASYVPPTHLANKGEIGSVWGLAFARETGTLYTGAFLKRHVGLKETDPQTNAPFNNPLGVIYATDVDTAQNSLFIDLSSAGIDPGTIANNAGRGLDGVDPNQPSTDAAAYPLVGKVGLGDLDLSADGSTLYAVNLNDKELVSVGVNGDGTAGAVSAQAIPDPGCQNGEHRPFGLKVYRGDVYIGVVCDASGSQDEGDLSATVYRWEGGTAFTDVLTFDLDYSKGITNSGACATFTGWYAWLDSGFPAPCFTDVNNLNLYSHPQPLLSDIEFDRDGSMILGFTDRSAHQIGYLNADLIDPPETNHRVVAVGGDLLRAHNDNGTYVLESNATAGPLTTAGANNGAGPGGGEFYYGEFGSDHSETSMGAVAMHLGRQELMPTLIRPNQTTLAGTGGVSRFESTTGVLLGGYTLYQGDNATNGTFGKGNGLGDLELLCAAAPLEIGNYVWLDEDGDGIQDPCENPIEGVVVRLLDENDQEVATATTGPNGEYYFNSVDDGLLPNTKYTLSIDLTQSSLADLSPTLADQASGIGDDNDDERDSDGVQDGTTVMAMVMTGDPGQNDHSFDFGFTEVAPVSLGDKVFYDTNQDGLQDVDEPGVNGVTVELFVGPVCLDPPAEPFATTTTANGGPMAMDGFYQFSELTPGTYSVRFRNLPANTTPTAQGDGTNDGADSDANADGCIENIVLTADDPDEDLGILAVGSIGDQLWCEASDPANNTYEAGTDTPLPGIGVSLYSDPDCDGIGSSDDDGSTLVSIDGLTNPVDSNGSGVYGFTNLAVALAGTTPRTCYVTEVDAMDADLNDCDQPVTPTAQPSTLTNETPNDPNRDFGFIPAPPTPVSLGDKVFYDTDGDGVQDGDEPGVNDVTVTLYEGATCTGTPVGAPQTTVNGGTPAADGFYTFPNLLPGTYSVRFSDLPVNTTVTDEGQGIDDSLDSDAVPGSTPGTACIENINLTVDDPDEDVGVLALGSIGDQLWCESDTNANATYEPGDGDAPLPNIGVTLFADIGCDGTPDGAPLALDGLTNPTQSSDPDGLYGFANLPAALAGSPQESCYVTRVDVNDADLHGCNQPVTPAQQTSELTNEAPNDPDRDFGFSQQPTFILGDKVFYDTNQDGVQDDDEPGVEDVTATLYSDAACTTPMPRNPDTTDGNGSYLFSGLLAGTYSVQFSNLPAGFQPTLREAAAGTEATDSDANPGTLCIENINLAADDLDEDLGIFAVGSIGDQVWCEVTNPADGTFNAGADTPLDGIGVSIFTDANCDDVADSDTPLDSTSTAGGGLYGFTDLPVALAGSSQATCYVTRVNTADADLGACNLPASPSERIRELDTDAPNDDTVDFYFAEPIPGTFSLGDTVFYDTNQNGIQEPNEPGVADISAELYSGPNCTGDALGAPLTTDGDGFYQFVNLTAAAYSIRFSDLPSGWRISPANQGGDDGADSDANGDGCIENINLTDDDPTQDVGIHAVGSISDQLWCESPTNANASYDPGDGDFALDAIGVSLFADTNCDESPDGAALRSVDSNGSGNYLFDNLAVALAGSGQQTCYVTEVDVNDPDLDGCTLPVTSARFANNLTTDAPDRDDNDFGFTQPQPGTFTLGNSVFYDTNGNGVLNAPEPGVPNIRVELHDSPSCSDVAPLATLTTDGNGFYQFVNLVAGGYSLRFVGIPAAWQVSPADQGDDALDSDANADGCIENIDLAGNDPTRDIGVFVTGSVSSRLWCEAEADGTYNPEEDDALESVSIAIFADPTCGGTLASVDADTRIDVESDAEGIYRFDNLAAALAASSQRTCYVLQVDGDDGDLDSCAEVPDEALVQAVELSTARRSLKAANFALVDPTPEEPKPVVLVRFSAEWQGEVVEVKWETSSEIDTVGFRLYRSPSGDRASAQLITQRIISSQGSEGGLYRFSDRNVELGVTYSYWLAETTLSGKVIEYGPVNTNGIAVGGPEQSGNQTFLPLINKR